MASYQNNVDNVFFFVTTKCNITLFPKKYIYKLSSYKWLYPSYSIGRIIPSVVSTFFCLFHTFLSKLTCPGNLHSVTNK